MTVHALFPMVSSMSKRFDPVTYGSGDHDDIRQEGMVGLLEASARYDPGRGATLTTYGGVRAQGAMMDHARRLARWGRELPDAGRPTGARESSERGSPDGRSMESRVQVFRFAAFLREQWPTLPEAERDVLRMRYFEGVPVRAVAAHLGVSGATVLRLEQKAIDVLRERYLASVGRRAR